ncbi:hypothetical protein GPECTOR_46g272 [Gonium pectorale]|uniref:Peptidase S8/S53 domain-containing protein n=1 Tax=Gonium pectorale TaxID=33097 RepID=A0A150G8V9_GONPE|nr:hypothetical protein GPECTOR_46g272 [Gonium pectorale]|eukprot:KXZ46203.1 hypothetical protein GPECTOR_46g272 [Gonium pectorale]
MGRGGDAWATIAGPAQRRRRLSGGGGPSRDKLLAALAARGVSVLSYIPDASLLIVGRPEDVEEVVKETGAEMEEYGPEHCIAPEWDQVLGTAGASAAAGTSASNTSAANLQRQRRRLSHSADTGAAAPAGSGPLLARMAVFDPRVVPGGAGLEAARRRMRRQLGEGEVQEDAPLPPLYEVSVDLLPGLQRAALAAAEKEWPEALAKGANAAAKGRGRSIGECLPLVVAPASEGAGDGTCSDCWLRVYVCEQHLASAVSWLASQPVVKWVAPALRITRRNAAESILLQTGDLTLAQYSDPVGPASEEASRRPYRAAGLDGSGEVVGIGDTGIDLDSCYFADPRVNATSYRTLFTGYPPRYRPTDHRKIAQYYVVPGAVLGDDPVAEQSGGHGTHTSGSLAGAVLSGFDPYGPYNTDVATGGAPRARLSMVDINIPPSIYSRYSYMAPPQPVDTGYLSLHKAVGAAIVSDSWGSDQNLYDDMARAYDRFLWNNPDMISFIAAGNNGTDALTPGGSIGTPATAKNVVAVGNGLALPEAARLGYTVLVVRGFQLGAQREEWRVVMYPLENPFKPSLSAYLSGSGQVRLVLAKPADACSPLVNEPGALSGAVVLVRRGTCTFVSKAEAAFAAGGRAVVFMNNVQLMMLGPPEASRQYPNPVSVISQGLGDWFVGNISAGLSLTVASELVGLGVGSVHPSSSYGPMADGRIKPDIVAPGTDVVSAGANGAITANTCVSRQATLTGTSMATPQAAGHAALIRQYLRTGYYPTGSRDSPDSAPFAPSGMLIKALIIAGAQAMTSALSLGVTLGRGPDGFQGWGRLSLSGALPLPGWTDPRVSLQLADRGELAETGQEVSMTGISATGTGPVKVVLTWYDYPADVNAATQLVNDLDLTVTVAPQGGGLPYMLLGNNAEGAAFPGPDRTNVVERVVLSAPPAGAAITIAAAAAYAALPQAAFAQAALPQAAFTQAAITETTISQPAAAHATYS